MTNWQNIRISERDAPKGTYFLICRGSVTGQPCPLMWYSTDGWLPPLRINAMRYSRFRVRDNAEAVVHELIAREDRQQANNIRFGCLTESEASP